MYTPPPPELHSIFKKGNFKMNIEWKMRGEDNRWVKERKKCNKEKKESENKLPFNSQDFFPPSHPFPPLPP